MVRYVEDMSTIEADQLQGFFVGWPAPPSPERHLAVLRGSYHAVVALDEADRAIGFINMISDGVLTAFIPWLEVLPAHQGQGIGAELVQRALKAAESFYSVDLLCDEALQPYYERLGLFPLPGMGWRNREALQG